MKVGYSIYRVGYIVLVLVGYSISGTFPFFSNEGHVTPVLIELRLSSQVLES